MIDLSKVDNVMVAGIDTRDYPDFCDAYIESADYDGVPMNEQELDELNTDGEFVHQCVMGQIF